MSESKKPKSDPKEIIARLKDEIRGFWAAHERKFIEVWKLLEKDGKTKFAKACSSLSPQAELLFPEITVEQIVEEEEHASKLFWYYNTDDGVERDVEMLKELQLTGKLEGPLEQALAIRQMGIMTCLRQLISAYEAVWTKSVAAEQKKKDVQSEQDAKELKAALLRAAESVAKNQCFSCKKEAKAACSRCQKIKYCGKDCQKAHWGAHKKWCMTEQSQESTMTEEEKKAKLLKDKLNRAKQKAREAGVEAHAPRVRTT